MATKKFANISTIIMKRRATLYVILVTFLFIKRRNYYG
nr:MAG TPA: hypothetical protein [Caudoviricetes sp.]